MGPWTRKAACAREDLLLTNAAHQMPEEISKPEFKTSTGHHAKKTLIVTGIDVQYFTNLPQEVGTMYTVPGCVWG